MYCVELSESFQTHIYLQTLASASIQPRTSLVKLAASRAGRPVLRRGLGTAAQAVPQASLGSARALGQN